MKEIITTPFEGEFTVMLPKGSDPNEQPAIMALRAKGKKLFVEYDDDTKLIKQLVDLDALGLSHIETVEEFESVFGYKPYQEGEDLVARAKARGKKPAPDYEFEGKFYADEFELAEALVAAGKLEKLSNATVYDLCWELAESLDLAFTFNDLGLVCDGLAVMLGEYDQSDLEDFKESHGFSSFSYADGKSITIDGVEVKWDEAEAALAKHGIITVEELTTLWSANSEEWYKDLQYPLEALAWDGVFQTFESWLGDQPEGIYEKLSEEYDI